MVQWWAYDRLEGLRDVREDARAAMLATIIAAGLGAQREDKQLLEPRHFVGMIREWLGSRWTEESAEDAADADQERTERLAAWFREKAVRVDGSEQP